MIPATAHSAVRQAQLGRYAVNGDGEGSRTPNLQTLSCARCPASRLVPVVRGW